MFGGVERSNNQALPSIQGIGSNGLSAKEKDWSLESLASFLAVAVTLSSGKIFLTGGKNTEKKAFLVGISEDAVDWTECSNMKYERIGHAGVRVLFDQEEQVVVAGGWNLQLQAQDTVEKYSFESNSWKQLARLPQPRAYFALQVPRYSHANTYNQLFLGF